MKNQFVVYTDGSPVATVLFEGNRDETYTWLMNHTALDAPSYMVLDRTASAVQEKGEFVREFEEEMAKASTGFTPEQQDEIRKTVREELKMFMESFVTIAKSHSEGTIDMAYAAHDAIETVARSVDYYLPHAWDCEKRQRQNWNAKCTCGVVKG